MKPFTIYTDSWHYRFLNWWHVDNGRLMSRYIKEWDFCTYWRKLILTMLAVAFRTVFVGAVLGALASAAFIIARDVILLVFTQDLTPQCAASCVFVILTLTCILVSMIVNRKRQERYEQERLRVADTKPTQPSIIAQAYRSWRNKFCMRVEFVDRSEEM